jgi:receptor protein-tyrosine kinase
VTVRDYVRVLREHRLLIIVVAALFAGLAYANAKHHKPSYQASAKLQFTDQAINGAFIGAIVPQDISPDQRAAIHAERIYGLQIAQRTAQVMNLPQADAQSLLDHISTRAEAKTDLVVVTATSRSATDAANLANAYAQAARDQTTSDVRAQYQQAASAIQGQITALANSPSTAYFRVLLQTQKAQMQQGAAVAQPASVVLHARIPTSPTSPMPARDGTLGLIIGLTLGILLAFLRDGLDRRFKSSTEVSRALDLPVVGFVRERALGRTAMSKNGRRPLSAADLEAFRILRTNLDFLGIDRPPKVTLVTSALPEEGKSTVAAALAATHAAAGKRTLLVECDLRFPSLAERLGLDKTPGLSDYLLGGDDPRQRIELSLAVPPSNGKVPAPGAPAQTASIDCIVAGSRAPQPAELLGSQRFATYLRDLTEQYDAIVIDTSPVLPVADALELVNPADGIVLCVRVSKTRREQAAAAKTTLERFPRRPTGIVITGLRLSDEADAYPSYTYIGSEKRRRLRLRRRAAAPLAARRTS